MVVDEEGQLLVVVRIDPGVEGVQVQLGQVRGTVADLDFVDLAVVGVVDEDLVTRQLVDPLVVESVYCWEPVGPRSEVGAWQIGYPARPVDPMVWLSGAAWRQAEIRRWRGEE